MTLLATATDVQLRRRIEFLKAENEILRARLPDEIHTRHAERVKLLKFGLPHGMAIEALVTIVSPSAFYRWRREASRGKARKRRTHGKSQLLRDLVIEVARSTGFGYSKILGELRRLGISRICRQTVKNILKDEGIEPSPKRSRGTWDEFLKAHAETLWACDFFTKRASRPVVWSTSMCWFSCTCRLVKSSARSRLGIPIRSGGRSRLERSLSKPGRVTIVRLTWSTTATPSSRRSSWTR